MKKTVLFLSCFAVVAFGRVIVVPDSVATIQAGLGAAQSGDTVLVKPGTYTENIVWPSRDGIKLYSLAGPDSTVISGGGSARVISIWSGASRATEIRGFEISGGKASSGAGILAQGSPTIAGNRIKSNVCSGGSDFGGGIFCAYQASPLIADNEISDNFCTDSATWNYGGGIYLDMGSSAEIRGNYIAANTCSEGYWNYGAGIFCALGSAALIYQNEVYGNETSDGDRGHGAGICVELQARAFIFSNIIWNNTCYCPLWNYGGGISVEGTAAIINNTFENNSCQNGTWNYGGGIYIDAGDSALVKNNIITQGIAASGGGIYNAGYLLNSYNDVVHNHGGDYYGCSPGPGDISAEPLFTEGAHGLFYLSQIAAGQAQNSPCLDAGDTLLATTPLNLDSLLRTWTTRTDSIIDMAQLDMGYHYPGGILLGVADGRQTPDASRVTPDAWPTPFRTSVTLALSQKEKEGVRVSIFDAQGRIVADFTGKDSNHVVWNAGSLPAGVYCYRITASSATYTGRVVKLD